MTFSNQVRASRSVAEMQQNKDFEAVAAWVNERLEPVFSVNARWVEKELSEREFHNVDYHGAVRSDSTYYMWFKNRLEEHGLLPCAGSPSHGNEEDPLATATFHVGFIFIEETKEQVALLPKGEPRSEESSVARSKISKTVQHIEPINSVASKVAPK